MTGRHSSVHYHYMKTYEKHYQKRVTLEGVFLDGNGSQLGKGAGHDRVYVLQVLSCECALSAKHPLVEGLTQRKIKLENGKFIRMIHCYKFIHIIYTNSMTYML